MKTLYIDLTLVKSHQYSYGDKKSKASYSCGRKMTEIYTIIDETDKKEVPLCFKLILDNKNDCTQAVDVLKYYY